MVHIKMLEPSFAFECLTFAVGCRRILVKHDGFIRKECLCGTVGDFHLALGSELSSNWRDQLKTVGQMGKQTRMCLFS